MKANTINLYKHFCSLIENPKGVDSAQRNMIRNNAIKGKENLENHFKKSRKYANDPEIIELLGLNKPEVKEDGKKSKR